MFYGLDGTKFQTALNGVVSGRYNTDNAKAFVVTGTKHTMLRTLGVTSGAAEHHARCMADLADDRTRPTGRTSRPDRDVGGIVNPSGCAHRVATGRFGHFVRCARDERGPPTGLARARFRMVPVACAAFGYSRGRASIESVVSIDVTVSQSSGSCSAEALRDALLRALRPEASCFATTLTCTCVRDRS